MKIFNNPQLSKVMNLYNKNKSAAVDKAEGVKSKKDQVEISDKAKEFQIAMKAFKALPDIRENKVNEIKQRIETGSYNVSGQEIAEKMVQSVQIDKKI
ncbi:flagellar biosynthesis anti-sigma factor FlgM [Serpentinicella sp. ANB-PHB4]|uniref:flagellar biosynthesis anti-sigma factor FlgM n=1 Tax=Serpentinicella sp. ANB-PHB4 TaxID=3074076 RepID=UPI002857FB4D|nr:flagellar biosynthesis anti-sigma factor FlgM [Serpentinicella sp. ANB-PHB4]MDR5659769.1 flagellar biosynthesis anti-sigma factor FlgM [Serpentinicella sp. ANB-PHB4]